MTEYPHLDDLLEIARHAIAGNVVVRDYGLLESILARPRA
jgi:death on curing protein